MASRRTLAALALAAAGFTAPSLAATSEPYYQAELAAPAGEAKVIANGVLWSCEGTSCIASKNTSRPLTVCLKLARATTEVVRFSVAGKDLSGEELARCNA